MTTHSNTSGMPLGRHVPVSPFGHHRLLITDVRGKGSSELIGLEISTDTSEGPAQLGHVCLSRPDRIALAELTGVAAPPCGDRTADSDQAVIDLTIDKVRATFLNGLRLQDSDDVAELVSVAKLVVAEKGACHLVEDVTVWPHADEPGLFALTVDLPDGSRAASPDYDVADLAEIPVRPQGEPEWETVARKALPQMFGIARRALGYPGVFLAGHPTGTAPTAEQWLYALERLTDRARHVDPPEPECGMRDVDSLKRSLHGLHQVLTNWKAAL